MENPIVNGHFHGKNGGKIVENHGNHGKAMVNDGTKPCFYDGVPFFLWENQQKTDISSMDRPNG